MNSARKQRYIVALIVIVAMLITTLCAVFANGKTVEPAIAEENSAETIKIAHITDLHYYPTYFCYNGENLEDTSFYDSTNTNTKLLVESSAFLKATLNQMLTSEDKPDYLVVSGDTTAQAERRGHIDVANALRDFQNKMREYKPYFQVFVSPGNHDIYNNGASRYDSNGTKVPTDTVSSKMFYHIYESLGYPSLGNYNNEDGFYSAEEWGVQNATVLPYDIANDATTSYINSSTASNIELITMAQDIGVEDNADYMPGQLTTVAKIGNDFTVFNIDVVLSAGTVSKVDGVYRVTDGVDHIVGGMMQATVKDWLTSLKQNERINANSTMFGLQHHNILPHFTKEENYLDQFVVYNWEETAEYLADYGIRYMFTGHMHANDAACYVSANGNPIFDTETTSVISYPSGYRITTFARTTLDGKIIEDAKTETYSLKQLDLTYLFEFNYLSDSLLSSESNVSKYIINENNNYLVKDVASYMKAKSFDSLIVNYIHEYLNPDVINKLKGLASGLSVDNRLLNTLISNLMVDIDPIIDNLFNAIDTIIMADYTKVEKDKIFSYLNDVATELLLTPRSDIENHKMVDVVLDCFMMHLVGGEVSNVDELPPYLQKAIGIIKDGSFVNELIEKLVYDDNGFYSILKKLLTTDLDLSANLTNKAGINTALKAVGSSIDKVNLEKIAIKILNMGLFDLGIDVGDSIVDFADDAIDKYLTESFKTGLGGVIADLLTSFTTDVYADGAVGEERKLIVSDTDTHTYDGSPRTMTATIENGLAPAKLTVSFGSDPKSTKNFVWQTNKRITGTNIQYAKADGFNNDWTTAITKNGDFEIYAYNYPVFDFGVFCATYCVKEIGRHSIELTDLDPDTKYVYRVGDATKNYWSPTYSFETAPDLGGSFEVLLTSDLQGVVRESYELGLKVVNASTEVFNDNDYDFIINCGDFVDNGKSSVQWGYALDTDQSVYGNTTQVMAIGNHENKYFTMAKANEEYTPSSDSVVTNDYNHYNYYYNFNGVKSTTGVYYSFDYSDVHFVVLNTNDIETTENNGTKVEQLSAAQYSWLENDLKSTERKFTVVMMHKGLYSAGAHSYDTDVIGLRAQLTPLFYDNGVNLVFAGHDHTYSETYYLDRDGKAIEGKQNGKSIINNVDGGVLYVTLGTVSDKRYDYVENESVPVYFGKDLHNPTLANPVFGKLYYDGENLYYDAYEYDLESGEIKPLRQDEPSIVLGLCIAGGVLLVAILAYVFTNMYLKKKIVNQIA